MKTYRSVVRTAKLLIEEHGASAPLQAAQRADERLDEGDIDGSMFWGQTHEMIEEITRNRSEKDLPN